jgi:hypothetical protein
MGTIRGMEPLPPRLGRPSRCSDQRHAVDGPAATGSHAGEGLPRDGVREQRQWSRGPSRAPFAGLVGSVDPPGGRQPRWG